MGNIYKNKKEKKEKVFIVSKQIKILKNVNNNNNNKNNNNNNNKKKTIHFNYPKISP